MLLTFNVRSSSRRFRLSPTTLIVRNKGVLTEENYKSQIEKTCIKEKNLYNFSYLLGFKLLLFFVSLSLSLY